MTAGRELDALVAEQVMGMVLPDTLWLRPSEISTEEAALIILPAYSTSIAAAWPILEKADWWRLCGSLADGPFFCTIALGHKEGEENADTAPLAICLAALRAVGVQDVLEK